LTVICIVWITDSHLSPILIFIWAFYQVIRLYDAPCDIIQHMSS